MSNNTKISKNEDKSFTKNNKKMAKRKRIQKIKKQKGRSHQGDLPANQAISMGMFWKPFWKVRIQHSMKIQ